MGLGPLRSVSLPEAREKAAPQRSLLLSGLDPIEAREEENNRRAIEAAKAVTFCQCAASYIESHRKGWRNEKHAEQWENTIETYCGPVIGKLPVQDVDTGLVLKILEPIWAKQVGNRQPVERPDREHSGLGQGKRLPLRRKPCPLEGTP